MHIINHHFILQETDHMSTTKDNISIKNVSVSQSSLSLSPSRAPIWQLTSMDLWQWPHVTRTRSTWVVWRTVILPTPIVLLLYIDMDHITGTNKSRMNGHNQYHRQAQGALMQWHALTRLRCNTYTLAIRGKDSNTLRWLLLLRTNLININKVAKISTHYWLIITAVIVFNG